MRFKKLVLHNFGAFKGRHELDLQVQPERPIILIGALNGSGKTTLLDALKLVLYGKRARCSTRGGVQSYEDFLRACVHRDVRAAEGASLELSFSYFEEGSEHTVRLLRSWAAAKSSVKEHLDVWVDGQLDPVTAEYWADRVEEFLPQQLSGLFLFDGEQIVELATPGKSEEIIRTAIDGLLGADRVTQLIADLDVVRDKQVKRGIGKDLRANLAAAETNYQAAFAKHEAATERHTAAKEALDSTQQTLDDLDGEIGRKGGDLYEQRDALKARAAELEKLLQAADHELRVLAAGPLPFALAADELRTALAQAEHELKVRREMELAAQLAQRESELLGFLADRGGTTEILAALRERIAADQAARQAGHDLPIRYGFSQDQVSELRTLLDVTLPAEQGKAREALARRAALANELEQLERKLVGVPDTETMRQLLLRRHDLREQQDKHNARLKAAGEELTSTAFELQVATSRLERLREDAIEAATEQDDALRVAAYAKRTQATLASFRERLIAKHADQLAELVLASFRSLYRKKTALSGLRINPADCSLLLMGRDNTPIPADRLSAGERQVLAVALLWGLAKASGRPLPAVIDTPLGRLDNKHRGTLVDHYFPHASHQVMILSTDSEIDQRWYDRLAPYIASAYTLSYDEPSGSTRVHSGYLTTPHAEA